MGDTFRIISAGRPIKGHEATEVAGRVAELFKSTPDKVARLLGGRPMLIRRSLDEETATRMLRALKSAGLLCKVEKESTRESALPAIRDASTGIEVINPALGPGSVVYSAMQANEISASESGFNFNKQGARDVPYAEIILMAVYEMEVTQGSGLHLMVYTARRRRPFVIEAQGIKYRGFEGVRSESMSTSLRQLILHVHKQNPAMLIDAPTRDFMAGAEPRDLKLEESVLATALGLELEARGVFVDEPGEGQQEFINMKATLELIKRADRMHSVEVSRGRSRMALSGSLVIAFVVALGLTGQMRLLFIYKNYFTYNTLLSHLLMWSSLLLGIAVLALALRAALHVRRHEWYAQGSVRAMVVSFVLYSSVRLWIAVLIYRAVLKHRITGIPAFYEAVVALKHREQFAYAFFYSYLWLAIVLCPLLYFMFVRSADVTKDYQ